MKHAFKQIPMATQPDLTFVELCQMATEEWARMGDQEEQLDRQRCATLFPPHTHFFSGPCDSIETIRIVGVECGLPLTCSLENIR